VTEKQKNNTSNKMHFILLIPALPIIFWYNIWKSSYYRAPILSCSRTQ